MATTARAEPLILELPLRLVMENRSALKSRVLDALAGGQKRFVLDCEGCKYIDSSGLGVLVSIRRTCHLNSAVLVICALNDDLQMLFDMTKIAELFAIAGSREIALEWLTLDA